MKGKYVVDNDCEKGRDRSGRLRVIGKNEHELTKFPHKRDLKGQETQIRIIAGRKNEDRSHITRNTVYGKIDKVSR